MAAASATDNAILSEVKNVPKLTFANTGTWKKKILQALGTAMVTSYVDGSFDKQRESDLAPNSHFDASIAKAMMRAKLRHASPEATPEEKADLSVCFRAEGLDSVDLARFNQFMQLGIDICQPTVLWWKTLSENERIKHVAAQQKATSMILATLGGSFTDKISMILKSENKREIPSPSWLWDRLDDILKKSDLHIKLGILKEVVTTKLLDDEDPLEYLSRMGDIQDRAKILNIGIIQELYPQLLINGIQEILPEAYNSVLHSEELNYDKVEAILRRESDNMRNSNKKRKADQSNLADDGFTGNNSAKRQKVKCNFCGYHKHSESECYLNPHSGKFNLKLARSNVRNQSGRFKRLAADKKKLLEDAVNDETQANLTLDDWGEPTLNNR
jgi:hypothetical protein